MNKQSKIVGMIAATITTFIFSVSTTTSAQPSNGTLIIHAEYFPHDSGMAVANLYRENDEIPKKPFLLKSGHIKNGKATILFEDLPFGEYALIIFHDENSNGILDHRFFFPAEPVGFSNGWEVTLFSGMPSFAKLRFEFSALKNEYVVIIEE